MCIDGNTLDQLPEDGNLTQLRVIAIDSPTMDTPTSTASTSTSSSAPITSTSPDDVILTCNSSLIDAPYDSYCAHLPQLFVPTAMRSMTEQEAVVKAVEERQSSSSPSSWSATLMCLIDAPYDSYCAHLPQLFVPTAMRSMTEQEAVVKAVEERQSSSSPSSWSATLMCPSIGGMPINEFTTDSYFTCHFPTLFPTGAADFSCQGRQNQVTIFNKHITTMHI